MIFKARNPFPGGGGAWSIFSSKQRLQDDTVAPHGWYEVPLLCCLPSPQAKTPTSGKSVWILPLTLMNAVLLRGPSASTKIVFHPKHDFFLRANL